MEKSPFKSRTNSAGDRLLAISVNPTKSLSITATRSWRSAISVSPASSRSTIDPGRTLSSNSRERRRSASRSVIRRSSSRALVSRIDSTCASVSSRRRTRRASRNASRAASDAPRLLHGRGDQPPSSTATNDSLWKLLGAPSATGAISPTQYMPTIGRVGGRSARAASSSWRRARAEQELAYGAREHQRTRRRGAGRKRAQRTADGVARGSHEVVGGRRRELDLGADRQPGPGSRALRTNRRAQGSREGTARRRRDRAPRAGCRSLAGPASCRYPAMKSTAGRPSISSIRPYVERVTVPRGPIGRSPVPMATEKAIGPESNSSASPSSTTRSL